jgi:hypothetical protein
MGMQGDVSQQGGAFVLGPGPVAHLVHRDEHTMGHARIDDLLIAADQAPFFHPVSPPATQNTAELVAEK